MLGASRRSVSALSRVGGAWHQWRSSPAATIHTSYPRISSLMIDSSLSASTWVKNGERKYINLPAVWLPVLSATRNGGFRSLSNLNQRSGSFLGGRSLSTSVAIDTNPVGERFKCQHETRGKLCKTLEKRNILDHKRRLLANKYELRRNLYKALCRDPDLPSDMRDKHRCKLAKLPRNSAFVRVRNRCITTGRPRAVLRMFRMSRIVFREKASQGSLMGVKKSSW